LQIIALVYLPFFLLGLAQLPDLRVFFCYLSGTDGDIFQTIFFSVILTAAWLTLLPLCFRKEPISLLRLSRDSTLLRTAVRVGPQNHTTPPKGPAMISMRSILLSLAVVAFASCSAPSPTASDASSKASDEFGVLVMAHGGAPMWNEGVMSSVNSLRDQYPVEVAFGMADAVSLQEAVARLEARGVREIGVVRLFISGESWYERTQQILGIMPGAPARPAPMDHGHGAGHGGHGGHSMEFWKLQTEASFALSKQGLAESSAMDGVLVDRVRALSRNPEKEDVLILAHGPGDDSENERWIARIRSRANSVADNFPFRRVHVETLREDWPEKRVAAELRIRAFVERAQAEGGTAIVIPFRVHGFGPYSEVLEGLDFTSDGRGLVPHGNVTQWMEEQIALLADGTFRPVLN